MIPADTHLELTECGRCGAPVFTGQAGGLRWRLDRYTVPVAHALVLVRYGVAVCVVDRRPGGGLDAAQWTPDHDLTAPHRYLACPHVCESAAARGLEMV